MTVRGLAHGVPFQGLSMHGGFFCLFSSYCILYKCPLGKSARFNLRTWHLMYMLTFHRLLGIKIRTNQASLPSNKAEKLEYVLFRIDPHTKVSMVIVEHFHGKVTFCLVFPIPFPQYSP